MYHYMRAPAIIALVIIESDRRSYPIPYTGKLIHEHDKLPDNFNVMKVYFHSVLLDVYVILYNKNL